MVKSEHFKKAIAANTKANEQHLELIETLGKAIKNAMALDAEAVPMR